MNNAAGKNNADGMNNLNCNTPHRQLYKFIWLFQATVYIKHVIIKTVSTKPSAHFKQKLTYELYIPKHLNCKIGLQSACNNPNNLDDSYQPAFLLEATGSSLLGSAAKFSRVNSKISSGHNDQLIVLCASEVYERVTRILVWLIEANSERYESRQFLIKL